jgi:geranylgeranylglycerol-phosphate geranylgeranyltransferase
VTLKAFVTIVRPANALFGSLTVVVGILTSRRFALSLGYAQLSIQQLWLALLLAGLTYFCVAAAGNTVNDIYDLAVDRVNRPKRPLPSGKMTLRQAKALVVVLVLLGLLFAYLTIPLSAIGIWTLLIVGIFGAVGLLYAAKGKVVGLLGNLAVAISFAFGLFYGALITFILLPPVIWAYFITAASVLQGREIIKGIQDIKGDALRNVQTIARKYGVRRAAAVGAAFNVVGIVGYLLPWAANWLGWNWTGFLYALLLLPGSVFVAASAALVLRNPAKNAGRASLCDKLGAFTGLLNFVLGAIPI